MAFPTKHVGVKGLVGIGGGSSGVKQGLFDVDTNENGPVGARLFDQHDGSEYVYAYFKGAVGPGKLVAMDASEAIQTSVDAAFTDSAGSAKDDYAVGDTLVYFRNGAITSDDVENEWAGGYLLVTDAAGEGHMHKIQSHEAGSATTANVVGLRLFDPGLLAALDSESSGEIIGHPYVNLAINDQNVDNVVRGVTLVDVAAGEYSWIKKKGPAIVLYDGTAGTAGLGTLGQVSDSVNGAVQPFGAGAVNSEDDHGYADAAIVGEFMDVPASTEYCSFNLNI
jgi:hypothetical protein|tara:strand:- start:2129 stop:2968 length:840 start_codon:yes stop_codon:yes gene_type:complete